MARRKGKVSVAKIPGWGESVVVSDPALVKQIFTGKPDALHVGEVSPLASTLGPGSIFALDEDRHLAERRLMLPPFHGARMGSYVRIFEEEALAEMATWPVNEDFETLTPFMRITLSAILRTVFGAEDEEFDSLHRVLPPLVKLGSILTAIPPLQRDFGGRGPWSRFMRLRADYDAIVDRLIDKHRADPELESRSDVLALLLQARYDDGSPMTRDQLSDERLTILVAGHETTAASLAWAVDRLRRHPELVVRLREEALAGGSALREATVWEVQRTRPVIVAVDRFTTRPFALGEYEIPARRAIIIDFLGLHYDPQLFPDPHRFYPDRFLDSPPDTYSWVPFGGGVRRCVGAAFAKLEMDVVLRMLLTRCEIVPTNEPDERWRFRGVAFPPRDGGRLRVRAIDLAPLDEISGEPEAALAAT
jgi:cytochrome P450